MGVHRALGFAGGARGVDQNRQIARLHLRHTPLQGLRIGGQMRAPLLAQLRKPNDHGIVQAAQPLGVKDHDLAQQRQTLAHLQHLVELLVVFDEQYHRARVFAKVLHLGGGVGRVDAIGHRAAAEHGQIGHEPVAVGVGQNGGHLAVLQAQMQQAASDFTHRLPHLQPGLGLPDPQLFLPQPHLGAALAHRIEEQLAQRGAFEHHARLGPDLIGLPEVHAITASSSFSSSAARRARRRP